MEEYKWLASLGVGGVLAGFIFWFYRQDRINTRGLWQDHIKNLHELIIRLDAKEELRLKTYRDEAEETRNVLRAITTELNRR